MGFLDKWSTFDLPGDSSSGENEQEQPTSSSSELTRDRSLTERAELARRLRAFVSQGNAKGGSGLADASSASAGAAAAAGGGAAPAGAPVVDHVASRNDPGPADAAAADDDGTAAAVTAPASSDRDPLPRPQASAAAGASPADRFLALGPNASEAAIDSVLGDVVEKAVAPARDSIVAAPSIVVDSAFENMRAAVASAAFTEKVSAGSAGQGEGGGAAAAAPAAAVPDIWASGRLSVEALRQFVARSNNMKRFPRGVLEIKALFHGWVEPGAWLRLGRRVGREHARNRGRPTTKNMPMLIVVT